MTRDQYKATAARNTTREAEKHAKRRLDAARAELAAAQRAYDEAAEKAREAQVTYDKEIGEES